MLFFLIICNEWILSILFILFYYYYFIYFIYSILFILSILSVLLFLFIFRAILFIEKRKTSINFDIRIEELKANKLSSCKGLRNKNCNIINMFWRKCSRKILFLNVLCFEWNYAWNLTSTKTFQCYFSTMCSTLKPFNAMKLSKISILNYIQMLTLMLKRFLELTVFSYVQYIKIV